MRTFWVPFREQWVTGTTLTGQNSKTCVAISIATGKQAMIKHFPYCAQKCRPKYWDHRTLRALQTQTSEDSQTSQLKLGSREM